MLVPQKSFSNHVMKAKETTNKKFDAVKMMRDIRDKIDKETEGRTFEELKKYYEQSAKENKNRAKNKSK